VLIAIPVFDAFTALDAVGPYEVLQRLPGVDVRFIGHRVGPVRTENGMLAVLADATFADVPRPDVVVVPGGIGTRSLLADEPILDWIRTAHETTTWTTSVCTGSLLLAAAGLLAGIEATTHWGARSTLGELGAVPVADRVVVHDDRRIMTAAGVSSGIDMALTLSEALFDATTAAAMQLFVEYDPQPPFDSGSIEKATPAVVGRLIELRAAVQG
jgi:putative intracellular protease/amidase